MAITDLYKQGAKAISKSGNVPNRNLDPRAMEAGLESQVRPSMSEETPTTAPEETDEDPSVIKDVLAAPFRGILGAAESVADLVSPDDWNTERINFLGDSQTTAGGIVEGISQFLVGFIPGLGVAGWAGKAGKAAKVATASKLGFKTSKTAAAAASVSRKGLILKPIAAGAMADFTVFDGQEARLSDLIENYPNLSNPITRYLQYEGNDDGEIEGRLKNVVEGLVLEGVVGGALLGIIKSIKGIRSFNKGIKEGKSLKDAEKEGVDEFNADEKILGEEPPVGNEVKNDPTDSIGTPDEEIIERAEFLGIETLTPKGNQRTIGALRKEIKKKTGLKPEDFKPGKKVEESDSMFLDTKSKSYQKVKSDIKTRFDEIQTQHPYRSGGKQAVLRSVLRGVKRKSDLESITDEYALTPTIKAEVEEISKEGFEERYEQAAKLDFVSGTDGQTLDSIERLIKKGDDASLHEKWLQQNLASYAVLREVGEMAVGSAKKWADTGFDDQNLYKEFVDTVALYGTAINVNSFRARRDSLGLLERKFLKNKFKNSEINPLDGPERAADADYAKFLQERLGTKDPIELAKKFSMMDSMDNLEDFALGTKLAEKSAGRKLLDITQEYWVNSILSGPATQLVNIMGNILTGTMLTMERTMGALLTGNKDMLKATLNFHYTIESFKESLGAAVRSFKADDSILIKGSKQFDDSSGVDNRAFTADTFGAAETSPTGSALNFLGKVTRFPSRLLTTGDELFKNLAYRKFIRTELAMEAMGKIRKGEDLGINSNVQSVGRDMGEVAKYVEKNLDNYITASGHYYSEKGILLEAKKAADKAGKTFGEGQEKFIKDYIADERNKFSKNKSLFRLIKDRAEEGVDQAKLATHTTDIEKNSTMMLMSSMLNKHPTLKFLVPFLRTPWNILKFGVSRSPLGLIASVRKDFRSKLRSKDPNVKAAARGQLAMGSMTTVASLYFLMNKEERITGGGPRNRNELDALKATGWQPYSFKFGDKYVSYQRLDPLATMVQMSADFRDYIKYEQPDDDDRTAFELFSSMALVHAVNLTDKTFLKGVNNMLNVFRDPEYYGPKIFKDIAGGFVPNLANQAKNYQAVSMVREAKGLSDSMLKRIPGLEDKVAPKRTILGEEVYRQNPLGVGGIVNPLYSSKDKNDAVANELAKTGHGYALPSKYLYGIKDINLEEIEAAKGKYDAYDRLQELTGTLKIGGKNLRQSIKELIDTDFYKSLSNEDLWESTGSKSPRVKLINKLISSYRSLAKYELIQENPKILEMYKEALKARAGLLTPQQ